MRFIIITEAHLSSDSVGYCKTAWALIKGFDPASYDLLIPHRVRKFYKTPIDANLTCKKYFSLILKQPLQNRLGAQLNERIDFINYKYRKARIHFQSKEDKAAFIFVIPNTFDLLHYAYLMAKREKLPLHVFLMDDLFSNFQSKYKRSTVAAIFNYADKFVFISKYLQDAIFNKFKVCRPSTYFFNPPKKYFRKTNESLERAVPVSNKLNICYVGSIWPMHDSIYHLIQYINLFNSANRNKISLTIFTHMYHQLNLAQYENENILYGGFIKDADLIHTISQFDMGLITTSFSEAAEIKDVVATSLLTKLNDYVTACIPILHFGPSHAACHDFINKYKIGVCMSKDNSDDATNAFNDIFESFPDIIREYKMYREDYLNVTEVLCNSQNVISFLCTNTKQELLHQSS